MITKMSFASSLQYPTNNNGPSRLVLNKQIVYDCLLSHISMLCNLLFNLSEHIFEQLSSNHVNCVRQEVVNVYFYESK